jgi:hypothetical protein
MATTPERLLRDGSYNPVPVASGFATQDGTATPQDSPLSYTATIITLAVPARAVEVILRPTTLLRVSEDFTMTRYKIIDAGMDTVFPVGRQANVYIRQDSASGTVTFTFNLV